MGPDIAMWWARRIRQVGTKASGGLEHVELIYEDGSERVTGEGIHAVLGAVRRYSADRAWWRVH